MDNTDLKTLIDDYTEIEYRYGKLNGQISALISMCEYELLHKGKCGWHTDINSVDVPAALVLHMLGQTIPQDIKDLYEKETVNIFGPEDDE